MIGIIGERIKILRQTNEMNQKEFAQQVGISQPTLSGYEKGTAYPSIEVLIGIASKFGVSLDWLCGIAHEPFNVSTLSDFIGILFELDKASNLRYEIEVDNHLPNDLESDTRKWQAAIKFYGNDSDHPRNADICTFLSSFHGHRKEFDTYFTSKEQYVWWQRYTLDKYRNSDITKKEYEDLPEDQRIALRNSLILCQVQDTNE